MENMISGFPAQLSNALEIARKIELKPHNSPFHAVFISGLGGSGVGAGLLQDFVRGICKIPIVVSKGYQAPAWVNQHTLAICTSFSGNTEETLSVLKQIQETGAKIICIASGGKLIEIAQKNGYDAVQLPGERSTARAGLGYNLLAQLGVFCAANLIPVQVLEQVDSAQKLLSSDLKSIQEYARKIAGFLNGKTPVIYTADQDEAVAVRWRQQINENAKMLCWHHVIPEMNHNELTGWRDQRPDIAAIWLRNHDDHPRNAIRIEINKDIVEHYTQTSIEIYSKGDSQIEKALWLVHLGDWVSVYLAELRKVDPLESMVVDYLKAELTKA